MANNQNNNATRVHIPCRISFANIWEPKSINGSDEPANKKSRPK